LSASFLYALRTWGKLRVRVRVGVRVRVRVRVGVRVRVRVGVRVRVTRGGGRLGAWGWQPPADGLAT